MAERPPAPDSERSFSAKKAVAHPVFARICLLLRSDKNAMAACGAKRRHWTASLRNYQKGCADPATMSRLYGAASFSPYMTFSRNVASEESKNCLAGCESPKRSQHRRACVFDCGGIEPDLGVESDHPLAFIPSQRLLDADLMFEYRQVGIGRFLLYLLTGSNPAPQRSG